MLGAAVGIWTGSIDGYEAGSDKNGNAEDQHNDKLFWSLDFGQKGKVSRIQN